jgi:hypothetical protein
MVDGAFFIFFESPKNPSRTWGIIVFGQVDNLCMAIEQHNTAINPLVAL